MPPSREEVIRNFDLLVADWRQGQFLMRYFTASLMASMMVSLLCSAGSLVVLGLGLPAMGVGLVCVAGACMLHAAGTWQVLRRRYQVRFAVW